MLQNQLTALTNRELRRVRSVIATEFRRRYPKKLPPKYGLLNKGCTDEELDKILACTTSITARTIFLLQATLGLRVGEAVRIKREHLDLARCSLWVDSEKGSHPSMMLLHKRIHWALRQYLNSGMAGEEYLFPAREKTNRRPHVSPYWVAREFRKSRDQSGLSFSYSITKPCGRMKRRNPQYRLSTHSLRHYFITKVHDATGDIVITQRLARHRDIKSTTVYTHKSQRQINQALLVAFQ